MKLLRQLTGIAMACTFLSGSVAAQEMTFFRIVQGVLGALTSPLVASLLTRYPIHQDRAPVIRAVTVVCQD